MGHILEQLAQEFREEALQDKSENEDGAENIVESLPEKDNENSVRRSLTTADSQETSTTYSSPLYGHFKKKSTFIPHPKLKKLAQKKKKPISVVQQLQRGVPRCSCRCMYRSK